MGLDLYAQESNLDYINKVSGSDVVMDILENYSDDLEFFELHRMDVDGLINDLKSSGDEVAIETADRLRDLLNKNASEYFILHIG